MTIPSPVSENLFPKLLIKHTDEISTKENSEILHPIQLHEIYMFQFFKYCKFDTVSEITIKNVKGMALSPIKVKSFNIKTRVDEKYFFDSLLYAPIPFIFIPYGVNPSGMNNFCNGAFNFRESEKEGILMDLDFACNVGIDFLATEFLERKDVFVIFIGLHYNSSF